MNIRILPILLMTTLLVACCPTGTTVVLIPDAQGKVGKVTVSTKSGTTMLTQANESTAVVKVEDKPSRSELLSKNKINEVFGDTLAHEPAPPEHFRFYFDSGSADLLNAASTEVTKAKSAIEARKSCDLSVIGHSDTVGDNNTNRELSLKRAESVATALKSSGVIEKCFDIRYYGENDPAIPTADNVDEPRNRRVEVEVR